MSTSSLWLFNQQAGLWYYYEDTSQCIVYQDGRRTPYPRAQWQAQQRNAAQLASQPRTTPTGGNTTAEELARRRAQSASSAASGEYSTTAAESFSAAQATTTGPSTVSGQQQLDRTYRRRKVVFFQRYRVFKILWHESAGGAGDDNATFTTRGYTEDSEFGELIYSKIRWFVVFGGTPTHSLCLPIMTYNGQGVAKRGAASAHHAIIYTGTEPRPTQAERKKGTMRSSIKVAQDDPATRLDPLSRLNYSRIYTVEHNAKVKAFGWIHPNSRRQFDIDREAVFRAINPVPRTNVPGEEGEVDEEGEAGRSDEQEGDSESDGEESEAGSHDGSD